MYNNTEKMVEMVAPSDATTLILGDSGTGKELIAKAIHGCSSRNKKQLVSVNCAALTDSLLESELFGHEKGAFTGAHARKIGLVEAADRGTLFLDQIGAFPLALQVKLLPLLETGTYRRVGSVEPKQAEFRLVTATHRNLYELVEKGAFRRDLYYRISAFPIHLPALRERVADLPLLVQALLQRIQQDKHVHASTLACLRAYAFPGNIRELRNILERACLMADGEIIMPQHLPAVMRCAPASAQPLATDSDSIVPLAEMERRYLQQIVHRYHGDNKSLAQQLGISERTMYRKLKRYGLT